jgi:hypothetical protein
LLKLIFILTASHNKKLDYEKIFFLLITTIFINSCVLYKVKDLNENIEYQNIEFVKSTENYSLKKEVWNFNVIDLKKEWREIKSNTIKLPRDNNGNAIVVEKFELAGKGIKGKLYQVDIAELSKIKNFRKDRKLHIFRDELGSILIIHFRTELSINEKSKELGLSKGTHYFWISRQINTNQIEGAGLNIEIGGQKILKLNDTEMEKIWISTLK